MITMPNAPKLAELKSRACSLKEIQAALVQLIELHNGMMADINKMIRDGRIRGYEEARNTREYGL